MRPPEDFYARWVAAMVAVLGFILVVLPTVLHVGSILGEDPFSTPKRTQTLVREVGGVKTVETTTQPEDQSLLDRGLASGGLVLLRLAVVAMAAFLAGAVTQRIILADFAAKLGPLELGKVERTAAPTSLAVEEVARRIEAQMSVTRRAVALSSEVARRLAASSAASSRGAEEVARRIEAQMSVTRHAVALSSEVARRLDDLERRSPARSTDEG